jgi:hypothetical protein
MMAAAKSWSDPGTEAVAFGSGQDGPRSRSSWRRISSIARLSWSLSGGSSAYFIARPPLHGRLRHSCCNASAAGTPSPVGIERCDVRWGCHVAILVTTSTM